MKTVAILSFIFGLGSQAAASYTALAERCLQPGDDLETATTYSFHIEATSKTGILVAIYTDKLTDVYFGTIVQVGGRTNFSSVDAQATFTRASNDTGGTAIINGKPYNCDFSQ